MPEDHVALVRSQALHAAVILSDESTTFEVSVQADKHVFIYGLLQSISISNLRQWSELALQINSITIDFAKNTMKINTTNNPNGDFAQSDIVSAAKSTEQRNHQNTLKKKVKRRPSAYARTRPYGRGLHRDAGGDSIFVR